MVWQVFNARPGVADTEHDVASRVRSHGQARIRFAERDSARFDRQFASVRHGVAGVDDKIHEQLPDVAGIRPHLSNLPRADENHLRVFVHQPAQHFVHACHDRVEIEYHDLDDFPAAEDQELPREGGSALRRVSDFLRIFMQRMFGAEILTDQVVVSDDHSEDVVEIMGHATGQLPHHFHFLRLDELRLEPAPLVISQMEFGHVLIDARIPHDFRLIVVDGIAPAANPARVAIAAQNPELLLFSLRLVLRPCFGQTLPVLGMDGIGEALKVIVKALTRASPNRLIGRADINDARLCCVLDPENLLEMSHHFAEMIDSLLDIHDVGSGIVGLGLVGTSIRHWSRDRALSHERTILAIASHAITVYAN
jgi:hypothetical protein